MRSKMSTLERNVLYFKLLYFFQCHRPKCLVFLSHGFSEHLGLYNEIGKLLGNFLFFLIMFWSVGCANGYGDELPLK